MSVSERLAKLVKSAGTNDSGRTWTCDRARGVNGHEVVNGVNVTYYKLAGGHQVVKIGDKSPTFASEITAFAGESADGYATMTELETAFKARK